MMNENKVLTIYKGSRTYKTKDGEDRTIHKFLDDTGKEYEVIVFEPIPDTVTIDTNCIAVQLSGDKWNDSTKKYEKRIFYKSVRPTNVKK